MVPIAETKNLHPWAASLFDTSQAATAVTHPDGLHSDVSDSYVRLTGFDALTLASMRLSDLVHPEDRRRLAEAEAVGLGDFYRLEVRLGADCGGQPVWVRLTGRAVADFRQILLEDITVAKRDQLALLAAKDRFECAVRGTAEGIWDWNVLTGEDYFSDRWCDLLGYSHDELHPNYATWVELLHPDDREAALKAVAAHLSEQIPYDLEYRMRTKSGSYCWYRARGRAVWDESGRPVRMAGSISDIHRRKLDELRLTEWHNRYEAAVSVTGHVVYEWHPENGQVVWSGNLGALLGEPDSQSSPSPAEWIERVHPDDRHAMIGAMHRFVDCRGSFHHEYRLRKHDGSYMFVEGAARFYRDGSGALNRAIGRFVDVSERKRLEVELLQANERLEQRVAARTQELEETRQRLALALDGAQEGVWDWSAPHTWEFSPEFEALLGFEPGQLIPGGNLEIHPEDTESVAAGFRAHRVGSSPLWESEHRLRARSGDWMWVLARGKAVVRDSVGMALRIVGTIADIRTRKEIDARLRQAVDAAEAANRAKSLFLATMSHEIRTPMNGILGMSELLNCTGLNQEQREFTSQIRTSADSLLVVIDDILDFSKIEAGKVDIENVPFDLVEVVEDAVAVLGLKAEAKGIELLATWMSAWCGGWLEIRPGSARSCSTFFRMPSSSPRAAV